MDKKMMVCGILDDASEQTSYQMGLRTVSRESRSVRHVGDAMVIFDERRVAPLFEVSLGETSLETLLASFDWRRWHDKVIRVLNATPAKRPKQSKLIRKQAQYALMRQQVRQRTVVSYLARRGASRRNPKII